MGCIYSGALGIKSLGAKSAARHVDCLYPLLWVRGVIPLHFNDRFWRKADIREFEKVKAIEKEKRHDQSSYACPFHLFHMYRIRVQSENRLMIQPDDRASQACFWICA